MWPTISFRYTPLLPPEYPDRKYNLARRRNILIFLLLSAAVVVVVGATSILGSFTSKQLEEDLISSSSHNTTATTDTSRPDTPSHVVPATKERLSTEEIKAMVSQTRGFYVRDYSLGLGWNNVRYIIEASVLQARLLNRTLILPSFVYARTCAYEIAVCADEAQMLNRGDAVGWDTWRDLPMDEQMGWQIPIATMINITQLRRFQPVVTAAEYLRYAGLDPAFETTSGYWNRSPYHRSLDPFAAHSDATFGKPSLFAIENVWYDPAGTTRVDTIPEAMKRRGGWVAGNTSTVQAGRWESRDDDDAQSLLKSLLPDKNVVEWDEARNAVTSLATQMPESVGASPNLDSDDFIEDVLNRNGWEVLHTFQGAVGMDFVKHVVMPIRQVARRTSIRGFIEDYRHIDADLVLLAGETHLFRKPGQMRFTTQSSRELFQRLVLYHVVPLDKVYELARKLDMRISAINNGRQWIASHLRRGDFVGLGWAWGDSYKGHLERVKQHLDEGRRLLQSERHRTTYTVPGITPDDLIPSRPPADGDKFFITTDESDAEMLDYFAKNGAVRSHDLVTFEDRHEFGWGILFSDIMGLVEQATLARAAYFYGPAMSSFTGGVFNMRAVLGAEEGTALAD